MRKTAKKESTEPADDAARRLGETVGRLNPQRLAILWHLCRGEHKVGEVAELLGFGQSAASQNLSVLARYWLVNQRRNPAQPQEKLFTADKAALEDLLGDLREVFGLGGGAR